MHRFIAVAWDCTNLSADSDASHLLSLLRDSGGLVHAVRAPGLYVVHDWPGHGPWRSWALPAAMPPGTAGVILGQLFEQPTGSDIRAGDEQCAPVAIDTDAARRIVSSHGRYLFERYWGTYVGFLIDEQHDTRVALRSVGAGLACYRLQYGSIDIFFSDLADLSALKVDPLGVNWRYVAAFLRDSQLAAAESAVEGVTEVLAGERVRMAANPGRREMLWNPAPFCADTMPEGEYSLATRLRSTTQGCVSAWASVHRHAVLQLSGGFDSAVVLGCLRRARARPGVTCLNRYAELPGEDERMFARAAARLADVPLEEHPWQDEDVRIHDRLTEVPMAPKPSIPALLQIEARMRDEFMNRVRAQTSWSGQGGDHLFYQFATEGVVADYVCRHGITPHLWTGIRDAVRLTRRPILPLMRLAIGARWGRQNRLPLSPVETERSFLSEDLVHQPSNDSLSHPWRTALYEVAPGKQLQIRAFIELLHRHAPFARGSRAPEVHPLISQPLIELCLNMPTWVALRGGQTRALAREAFRDCLPEMIRLRETKGGTTLFLVSVLRREAVLIRELLLDGSLAREGLLKRKGVEAHFSPEHPQPLRPGQLMGLFACVAAEVWVRALSARQRSY